MFNPMTYLSVFFNPYEIIRTVKDNPNGIIILIAVIIGLFSLYYLYKWYSTHDIKVVPKVSSKEPVFLINGLLGTESETLESKYFISSSTGSEYTFGFWLYLNSIDYNYGEWKHVLTKGNVGINEIEQSPGIYIHPKKNALKIKVRTTGGIESFDVDDIYLKRWTNIVITTRDNTLELYINGELLDTHILKSNVKFCEGPLTLNSLGGFQGALSSLSYYPEYRTSKKIYNDYKLGPSRESLLQQIIRKITFGANPLDKIIKKLPESSTIGNSPVEIVQNVSK
jgi:hypothetical protein